MMDTFRLSEHRKVLSILLIFIAFQFLPFYLHAKNYFSWLLLYEVTLFYAVTSAFTSLLNRDSSKSLFQYLGALLLIFLAVNALVFSGYLFAEQFFPHYYAFLSGNADETNYLQILRIMPIFNFACALIVLSIGAMIRRYRLSTSKVV